MNSPSKRRPRGARRGVSHAVRLAHAYKALFAGNPTSSDCEAIVADLAEWSGFYTVTAPDATDAMVRFSEGKRAVFLRMVSYADMSVDAMRRIEQVAFEEAAISQEEGFI